MSPQEAAISDGPNDMAALERRERDRLESEAEEDAQIQRRAMAVAAEEATDPRALVAATSATAEARTILARNAAIVDTVLRLAEGVASTAVNAALGSVPGGVAAQAIAREVAALAIEEAARRARMG